MNLFLKVGGLIFLFPKGLGFPIEKVIKEIVLQ